MLDFLKYSAIMCCFLLETTDIMSLKVYSFYSCIPPPPKKNCSKNVLKYINN